MKNISALVAIAFGVLFTTGCGGNSQSINQKYSMTTTASGEVIRLNTATGETCIVSKNCDADLSVLKVGESYIYKGDGIFEHQKTVKWEDLK